MLVPSLRLAPILAEHVRYRRMYRLVGI